MRTLEGEPPGLFWLTRDFRFGANAALAAAISEGPLLAVFFVDRLLTAQGAASRWRLGRALRVFDGELRRRSGQSGVLVLRGEPDELLPELLHRTGAGLVHQTDWPTPAMRALQARVRRRLSALGAELVVHGGHLLVDPAAVRSGAGTPYRVFGPFARAVRDLGPARPGQSAPPEVATYFAHVRGLDVESLELAPDLASGGPVLEEFALPAGERAATQRLEWFLDTGGYAGNRDRPDIAATSGLSEHLALGEISPRSVWEAATAKLESRLAGTRANDVERFLTELLWREFAWHLLNEFPLLAEQPWQPRWERFSWRGENADHARWLRAETGLGLVDAGLREMRVTGRMHNRVRMVVAGWLTKQALTDWRVGLKHFEDSLTDWDPASNAMNWQWVAGCGPAAAPYFRILNPVVQAQRFDPEGRYRRRWLAGWEGPPTAEALAYLATVPSSWNVARNWREGSAEDLQRDGRQRALAAYETFLSRTKPS